MSSKQLILKQIEDLESDIYKRFHELKSKIKPDYVDEYYPRDHKLKIMSGSNPICTFRVRGKARAIKYKDKPLSYHTHITLTGLARLSAAKLRLLFSSLTLDERVRLQGAIEIEYEQGRFTQHNYKLLTRQLKAAQDIIWG